MAISHAISETDNSPKFYSGVLKGYWLRKNIPVIMHPLGDLQCMAAIAKVLISLAVKKSGQFCFIQIFLKLPWSQNSFTAYLN